jgi:hypothetical protein
MLDPVSIFVYGREYRLLIAKLGNVQDDFANTPVENILLGVDKVSTLPHQIH